MKNLKITSFLLMSATVLLTVSCRNNDDFDNDFASIHSTKEINSMLKKDSIKTVTPTVIKDTMRSGHRISQNIN